MVGSRVGSRPLPAEKPPFLRQIKGTQASRRCPTRSGPGVPPPHPRTASLAVSAGAGGKSLGRSPRLPSCRGRVHSAWQHGPRLPARAGLAAPRPGRWVVRGSAVFSARAAAPAAPAAPLRRPTAWSYFLRSGAVEEPQGPAWRTPPPLPTLAFLGLSGLLGPAMGPREGGKESSGVAYTGC